MLRWTERAIADLAAIGALDNPAAARPWVEKLWQRAVQAAEMPRAGRQAPEIGRDDVREVFLRSYRIVYRIAEDGIVIQTIFEGHRLLRGMDPETET